MSKIMKLGPKLRREHTGFFLDMVCIQLTEFYGRNKQNTYLCLVSQSTDLNIQWMGIEDYDSCSSTVVIANA